MRCAAAPPAAAYDEVRTTVGSTMAEVSEAVTGSAVVRAYGLEDRTRDRLRTAMTDQYRAHLRAGSSSRCCSPSATCSAPSPSPASAVVGALHGDALGVSRASWSPSSSSSTCC
jgi:hypothetical protein